jgi:hypothetical protein
MQRKYRNLEERMAICQDVIRGLEQLQILSHPLIKPLADDLERFVAATAPAHREFKGVVEIAPMGIKIEYRLPGRRIVPQAVRVSRFDPAPLHVPRDTLPL